MDFRLTRVIVADGTPSVAQVDKMKLYSQLFMPMRRFFRLNGLPQTFTRFLLILFLTFDLAMLSGCARLEGRPSGPAHAEKAGERMMKAMGGRRALDRIRFLSFEFVVREGGREVLHRSHVWDRATGRYRLEGMKGGVPYVALFNIKTRQGKVYEGNKPELAKDNQKAVEHAYAAFVSDTGWLLAALRLRDPGARLSLSGEQTIGGKPVVTLALASDPGVELAPGNPTWFYIENTTGLPYAWAFVLKGQNVPPMTFVWTNWQAVGKLKLPTRFTQQGVNRVINIERLFAPVKIGDNIFNSIAEPVVEKVRPVKQKQGSEGFSIKPRR